MFRSHSTWLTRLFASQHTKFPLSEARVSHLVRLHGMAGDFPQHRQALAGASVPNVQSKNQLLQTATTRNKFHPGVFTEVTTKDVSKVSTNTPSKQIRCVHVGLNRLQLPTLVGVKVLTFEALSNNSKLETLDASPLRQPQHLRRNVRSSWTCMAHSYRLYGYVAGKNKIYVLKKYLRGGGAKARSVESGRLERGGGR